MEVYKLVAADTIKNFLRIEMSFESGQAGYVIIELRSFSLKNGSKILIASSVGGAHNSYGTNEFQVFEYRDKKLIKALKPYLPFSLDLKDFLKPNTPPDVVKRFNNDTSHGYELGYGYFFGEENENIKYEFNSENTRYSPADTAWILGNQVEFVWKNDTFIQKKMSMKQ